MEINIITQEDLLLLKKEILEEIKKTVKAQVNKDDSQQWLRSAQVRKLLNISPGTLQNLRINGTLPYRKIGGSMYYNREDIQIMMQGGKDG